MAGLAMFATATCFATNASADANQWTNGFEGSQASEWWAAGNAGVDQNLGNAMDGLNNGWVNAYTGWNAINIDIQTVQNATCYVQIWIRTSSTLTNGYIAVRNAEGAVISTVGPFGAWPGDPNHKGYNFVNLPPFTADAYQELFYVGFWGNGGDSWIQADDLTVTCTS